jgi:hypothetical protein
VFEVLSLNGLVNARNVIGWHRARQARARSSGTARAWALRLRAAARGESAPRCSILPLIARSTRVPSGVQAALDLDKAVHRESRRRPCRGRTVASE